MVFRRRDRRSMLRATADFLYPRGGWTRAFHYVKHRLRRLPDSPERIARGIWAGVFASFTPFYGLHFLVAALVGRLMRGNILAALMGTFFGNPLTYLPIGVVALKTGHFLLGSRFDERAEGSFVTKFNDARNDLWNNFLSMFTDRIADWHGVRVLYDEIFVPYLVGGVVAGAIAGGICYYLTVPVIRAYKRRRRNQIKTKFEAIKQKAVASAENPAKPDRRRPSDV